MKVYCTLFLFLLINMVSFSQEKNAYLDSFCTVLNDAIKMASLDQINPAFVGTDFIQEKNNPKVKSLISIPGSSNVDSIEVINKKVLYYSTILSFKLDKTQKQNVYNKVKEMFNKCLDAWELDKINNKEEPDFPDLMYTNSEDETTVRVKLSTVNNITYFYMNIY